MNRVTGNSRALLWASIRRIPTARMLDVFACPMYWADEVAASSTVSSQTSIGVPSERRSCWGESNFGVRLLAMETTMNAPDFTLLNENGESVSLSQFRGKNVVLFFYPKADTPG